MSAPAIIFAASGLVSIGCLLLRRRSLAPYVLASLSCGLIGVLVLTVPLEEALTVLGLPLRIEAGMQLLGRRILVDQRSRAAISFLYLSGSLFFAVGWASRPGRSFAPVGVVILALLAGSLTIEPFLFAAVFLELAAMAAVLILVPPGSQQRARVFQLIILYTLAMVGILFTGWLFENVGVTSVTPELADRVMALLAFGLSILMFIPPFHYWLPSAAPDVRAPALAFVAVVLQSAGLFFLLRFLDTYAWLRADPRVMAALGVAGMATIAFGSLSAMAHLSEHKIAAYALIADFGVGLLAISANSDAGFRIALSLAGARVVGLVLYSLASVQWEIRQTGATPTGRLAGLGMLVGLASLAGVPLTAGFPARWTSIARLGLGSAGLWVPIGSALVMAAVVRLGIRTSARPGSVSLEPGAQIEAAGDRIGQSTSASEQPAETRRSLAELPERAALGAALALCLLLGVAPQLTGPWVGAAMRGLTNLAP